MAADAGDAHCRAAAYHESAHIVVACEQGLSISPKGIFINNFAEGRAWFNGATDGSEVPFAELDKVLIALFSGGIAHSRMQTEMRDACKGDDWRIDHLLKRYYADLTARQQKREQLLARATKLVTDLWDTIARVAEELWSKPWKPKNQHREWPKEKTLPAIELEPLIGQIAVVISEDVE